MRAGFADLRAEIAILHQPHGELHALQRQVTLIVGGFGIGLLGIMGTAVFNGGALAVDQPAVRRPGGLHDRLRERRVRVHDARHL